MLHIRQPFGPGFETLFAGMMGADQQRQLRNPSAPGQDVRKPLRLIESAFSKPGSTDGNRDQQIGLP
ncbi:hypothetical protein D3C74_460710 [compost metagenome]